MKKKKKNGKILYGYRTRRLSEQYRSVRMEAGHGKCLVPQALGTIKKDRIISESVKGGGEESSNATYVWALGQIITRRVARGVDAHPALHASCVWVKPAKTNFSNSVVGGKVFSLLLSFYPRRRHPRRKLFFQPQLLLRMFIPSVGCTLRD